MSKKKTGRVSSVTEPMIADGSYQVVLMMKEKANIDDNTRTLQLLYATGPMTNNLVAKLVYNKVLVCNECSAVV
jgi:hypothetical protein